MHYKVSTKWSKLTHGNMHVCVLSYKFWCTNYLHVSMHYFHLVVLTLLPDGQCSITWLVIIVKSILLGTWLLSYTSLPSTKR